jgi:hypothetical protein
MRMLLPTAVLISIVVAHAQSSPFALTCTNFPVGLAEPDLIARYGRENVINAPVFGTDDGPQTGTVLFPASNDARLEIAWQNENSKTAIWWVKAIGTRWTTEHEIRVGTTLRTVEELNGSPFRLSGFHTLVGGRVLSWAGGRMERPAVRENCDVRIQFQPQYDGTDDPRLVRQVRFGREYSSGHPALQKLNPKVAVIWIGYLYVGPANRRLQPAALGAIVKRRG